MHLGSPRIPAAALLGAALLLPAPPAAAGDFRGRVAAELEYLGETYFSEQLWSDADLGLPVGTGLVIADTTRFSDESWLPGPRLELAWSDLAAGGRRLELRSVGDWNRETASQEVDLRAEIPAGPERDRWLLGARGAIRDESRSLVGHGNWSTRLQAGRTRGLGRAGDAELLLSWEHSGGRGDTVTYIYDYDRLRARLRVAGRGEWMPPWEAYLEGTFKETAEGVESYRELRAGGEWRPGGSSSGLTVDLRRRDYRRDDGVGRDGTVLEAGWRSAPGTGDGVGLELALQGADYQGSDDLYYDVAEADLELPVRRRAGAWTVSAGPGVEGSLDLSGGGRDYLQGTVKLGGSRITAGGGFAELSLTGGRRNYRTPDASTVEITSLSSSFIRSDYWLLDFLAAVSLPLGGGTSLDLLATSSWEFHPDPSERIQVTLVSLGVARPF